MVFGTTISSSISACACGLDFGKRERNVVMACVEMKTVSFLET